jgi:hypothetical protein
LEGASGVITHLPTKFLLWAKAFADNNIIVTKANDAGRKNNLLFFIFRLIYIVLFCGKRKCHVFCKEKILNILKSVNLDLMWVIIVPGKVHLPGVTA